MTNETRGAIRKIIAIFLGLFVLYGIGRLAVTLSETTITDNETSSSVVEYKTIVVKTDEGEKNYEHINADTISEPNALNGSLRFTDKDGTEYHLDVSDYTIKSEGYTTAANNMRKGIGNLCNKNRKDN